MLWKGPWTCRTRYVRMKITTVSVEYSVGLALDLSNMLVCDDNNYSLCSICCVKGPWTCRTDYVMMTITTDSEEYSVEWALDL